MKTQIKAEALKISTELIKQIYCDDRVNSDVHNLWLKIRVNYENTSNSDLILYRGDEAFFFNIMISCNEENALARKYEYPIQACSSIPPKKFSVEAKPGKDFIILKGRQIFAKEATILLLTTNASSDIMDTLQAGEYILQIATSTWPGTNQQKNRLKHKWEKDGMLYTFNIESLPMRFSIVENPLIVDCPKYNE
ncbi:MAG: hypothetical protein HY819_22825 [Acidobacteria bacterium]|nr:hypothetical protein [Acidobacteriota bacterium]